MVPNIIRGILLLLSLSSLGTGGHTQEAEPVRGAYP